MFRVITAKLSEIANSGFLQYKLLKSFWLQLLTTHNSNFCMYIMYVHNCECMYAQI